MMLSPWKAKTVQELATSLETWSQTQGLGEGLWRTDQHEDQGCGITRHVLAGASAHHCSKVGDRQGVLQDERCGLATTGGHTACLHPWE